MTSTALTEDSLAGPILLYRYPGACSLAPLLVLEHIGVPVDAHPLSGRAPVFAGS